ncbi:YqaJ viral recombinase family protein [Gordonia sp. ABKF26]|uniref:YqaJ viral recombinase family protein n=1 Tax=Gordonia sp. ABKF26 TaxID=3238687 RepID=UPI0034E4252E
MTAIEVKNPPAPGTPEWQRVVSPSKIPALLGVSRFRSQYTVWHEMAGLVEPEPIAAARQDDFDYGHACELAAREYWLFKNPGWRLSRGEVAYRNDTLPFPNLATLDLRASRGRTRKVVEVKTARDKEEWGDDGSGEVPADYAAQVIAQQHITGWTSEPADIVVWFQFGMPKIYHVDYEPRLAAAMFARIGAMWPSIVAQTPPPDLDDSVSTYETVKAMHPDIDGTTAVLDPALARDFLTADADLKSITKRHRGLKTRVLDAMGNAQHAVAGHPEQKIARRQPGQRGSVSLYPITKTDPDSITTKESTAA